MSEEPKCPHCGAGLQSSASMGGGWGGDEDAVTGTSAQICSACGWGLYRTEYADGRFHRVEVPPRATHPEPAEAAIQKHMDALMAFGPPQNAEHLAQRRASATEAAIQEEFGKHTWSFPTSISKG